MSGSWPFYGWIKMPKLKSFIYNYPPAAAAAAKSLQSCRTLCDPRDGNPPGSSIHWIFQARVLEWCAIASPNTD